jgi:cytochrome c553
MQRTFWILSALFLAATAETCRGGGQQVPPEQIRFFETNIRPLLVDSCYKCHSAKKQKSGLRLDSRAAILKGGDSGPAVVPGDPDKSLLIRAVRQRKDAGQGEPVAMPPNNKLSDRQIADLARWIRMGLPYPPEHRTSVTEGDGRAFWAFKPPVEPPVPVVKSVAWPRSGIDHFILAGLETNGIKPARPADRRTLLRRATFDLTGLPPTPEEMDAFLKDTSAGAFARVVDRLLASPHYGERWGRHWLDVVRYADSNGLDENVAYGNAWRYRDYVVAAFNQDKPYDRFLLEQLAGDLLPSQEKGEAMPHAGLIATGFLALGPKVLAEVDAKKMEMDIIDEQIDTFGRTVLGLTLGCARCHDHKFDPFTMNDYYGLAGIFKSTRTMESFKLVARWHENHLGSPEEIARKASHDKKIATSKSAIQQLLKRADEQVKAGARPGMPLPKKLDELYPTAVKQELKQLRAELASLEKAKPELPSAMGVSEDTVADAALHVRGNHLKLGKVVHRHVPDVLAGNSPPLFDAHQSGRLELARWLIRSDNPLTPRVMVNRIWRWHFGHGIVRTPDNFGRLGEAPANQPLLDWLACRFIQSNWSIKALHRLILLSSTYQMSSAADPHALEADPDNRLHGRANVRRLEAEAVRDALLAVSGLLDRTMGGSLLQVKNRDYVFNHTSRDATKYDSRRRSLYLPVIRNNLYDVFGLFDFPDPAVPTGDRATTTVAPQALFLMNSTTVREWCERLAGELLREGDEAERIRLLYRKSYGRFATDQETRRALALIREVERGLTAREADADKRRLRAWGCLCQVVLSANEFVYVD